MNKVHCGGPAFYALLTPHGRLLYSSRGEVVVGEVVGAANRRGSAEEDDVIVQGVLYIDRAGRHGPKNGAPEVPRLASQYLESPPTHKAAITHTYGGYSAMTILPEATGLGNRHGRKKRVKISGAVPR